MHLAKINDIATHPTTLSSTPKFPNRRLMGTGGGREAIDDTDGRSSAMVATQRRPTRARRRSGCRRAPLARPRRRTGRGPRQEHRVGVHAALGGVASVDAGASRPRSSVRVPSNSATRARTTATAFPSGRDCRVLRARRSRRPVQLLARRGHASVSPSVERTTPAPAIDRRESSAHPGSARIRCEALMCA
jgi:hypothetical protein